MTKTYNRFNSPWKSFRFKLSCVLYKNPMAFLSGFLVIGLGVGVGAVAMRPAADAVATVATVATAPPAQPTKDENVMTNPQWREVAIKVSELEARANRLDAMGSELVKKEGLDKEAFDFNTIPAQGGGDDEEYNGFGETESSSWADEPTFNSFDLNQDINVLAQRLERLEPQINVLNKWSQIGIKFPESIPHAAPGGRYLTSTFGVRYDPFGRGKRFHSGMDLAARVGDPVRAMADGVVVSSGWKGGYGNLVEIDHGGGYHTRYGHNSKLVVRPGQRVSVGQIVARAGSTGRSTGAHVHIEVIKNGRAVNPQPFLDRGRQMLAAKQAVLKELAQLPPLKNETDTTNGFSITNAAAPETVTAMASGLSKEFK